MLLFTRPLPKLNVSASAFEQAGIDAVGVATTDIVHIKTESNAARQFLRDNTVDFVIVTSVYAVDTAVASVTENTRNSLPVFIAVGDATARKLRFGLDKVDNAIVLTPETHTSEGILAMHQLNNEHVQHVVIIKGEGGRDAIEQGLRDKFDKVQDISIFCVYKREQLASPISTKYWKISDVSGIIATSESMAMQLLAHFGNALLSLRWVCVSERIATSLNKMGATRVSVCSRATDQALITWVKDNWEY